ncbi:MAG: YqgE/AlgH family protein [Acidimicrobiales bacterium]
MRSLAGSFLISRPELADPNFDGTLTLILEHDEDGALGVVINRPTEVLVAEAYPGWDSVAEAPAVIFQGGPVETDSLIALGWGERMDGDLPLGLTSVDLEEQVPLVVADGLEKLRIFAGYAGWGGGQLEGELANGAWWVVPCLRDDVFLADPERLWAMVLRRNGGEMAWFAHYPKDPSLN